MLQAPILIKGPADKRATHIAAHIDCDVRLGDLSKGFAVLAIDLRGHGKSIYNKILLVVGYYLSLPENQNANLS